MITPSRVFVRRYSLKSTWDGLIGRKKEKNVTVRERERCDKSESERGETKEKEKERIWREMRERERK